MSDINEVTQGGASGDDTDHQERQAKMAALQERAEQLLRRVRGEAPEPTDDDDEDIGDLILDEDTLEALTTSLAEKLRALSPEELRRQEMQAIYDRGHLRDENAWIDYMVKKQRGSA